MRSAKFAWVLIAHAFMFLLSFNVFAETTYCFGEVCSENLAEPEAQMRSQFPDIGEKLIFEKIIDQPKYQTRHYYVKNEVSQYIRSRETGSLPDYGSWGSGKCPKSLDVAESGYRFQNWASTDRKQISAIYKNDINVNGSYGIYDEFLDKCTPKTYSKTHYFYRHDDYQCLANFTIDYGGSGAAATPVCKSDVKSFLLVYSCYYPFA